MSIKDKSLAYLTKHPKEKFNVVEVAKAIKAEPKSVAAQLPNLAKESAHVHKEKAEVGNGFVYWYTKQASNKAASKSKSSKKNKAASKSKSSKKNTATLIIPDSSGEGIAEQVVRLERQNQMYQQAFGQIASLLEQCGFIESA